RRAGPALCGARQRPVGARHHQAGRAHRVREARDRGRVQARGRQGRPRVPLGSRAARAGAARLRGAARLEGDHRRRARVQGAAGERAQIRRAGGGPGRRGGDRRVGGGGAGADHRAEESVPARIVATRTLALRSCLEDVVTEAIIVDAVRTARGKRKGALSEVHPVDLLAQTLAASLSHAGIKPQDVDDVIIGCVTQVGEQGVNIARGAVLAAGLPIEVPGTTVNRFCGSGLQAVNFGAQAVLSGASQLVVAGGVEHMTRVPMGSDAMGGEGPASPGLMQHWPDLVPQGLSAEMIASKWGYSREKLDEFALQSQRKAANAIEKGFFAKEIVPVKLPDVKVFDRDEHPRPGTTMDALAKLRPSFKDDGVLHAGNSS